MTNIVLTFSLSILIMNVLISEEKEPDFRAVLPKVEIEAPKEMRNRTYWSMGRDVEIEQEGFEKLRQLAKSKNIEIHNFDADLSLKVEKGIIRKNQRTIAGQPPIKEKKSSKYQLFISYIIEYKKDVNNNEYKRTGTGSFMIEVDADYNEIK